MGDLSGHSIRVGTALHMFECEVLLEKIILRREWKSERTAMCYIRNWNDDDCSLIDHELLS
jgi:hypothetical protein